MNGFRGLLASAALLMASPALALELIPAPPPPPTLYPVGKVLDCLEQGQRDICMMRMFLHEHGPYWLRQWVEVYANPELAGSLGIDLDAPPTGKDSSEIVRQALSLDRHGASADVALKPFDRLIVTDYGERYHGLEINPLLELVEMGRDPAFPQLHPPSPALAKAAEDRLKTAIGEDAPILRPNDASPYINLLIRWGDATGAKQIDAMAWRDNNEHALDDDAVRAERLARLGQLDDAAAVALALKPDPDLSSSRSVVLNSSIISAREIVAYEAERQGRQDIALAMARRLLEEACADDTRAHTLIFEFRNVLPVVLKAAGPAEASQWVERVEARSTRGEQQSRLDAALAAFRAWRMLGRPERAHQILEAWLPLSNSGSADYDFQPRGAVLSMLLAEGRIDQAWALDPDATALLKLDSQGSDNIEKILAKISAMDRLAALAACANHRGFAADSEQCRDRLEAAPTTPADKVQAARLMLSPIWTGPATEYGPYAYNAAPPRALIEARFQSVDRLLRAAVNADPQLADTRMTGNELEALVKTSVDARLIADRAARALH